MLGDGASQSPDEPTVPPSVAGLVRDFPVCCRTAYVGSWGSGYVEQPKINVVSEPAAPDPEPISSRDTRVLPMWSWLRIRGGRL